MKPVYQTKTGPKEGNCFAAAIASILEISIDAIPDILEDTTFAILNTYLKTRDLQYFEVTIKENETFSLPGYYIIVGRSPRSYWVDHCLVGYKGKAVHDPLKDGDCKLAKGKELRYGIFITLKPEEHCGKEK